MGAIYHGDIFIITTILEHLVTGNLERKLAQALAPLKNVFKQHLCLLEGVHQDHAA